MLKVETFEKVPDPVRVTELVLTRPPPLLRPPLLCWELLLELLELEEDEELELELELPLSLSDP